MILDIDIAPQIKDKNVKAIRFRKDLNIPDQHINPDTTIHIQKITSRHWLIGSRMLPIVLKHKCQKN